jgi:hypothetical protein
MAEGKRDTVTNAVLGIASLVAAALGILYLSGQSDRYNRDATDRAHHYARNAESEIARNCRVGVSADPAECINETVYAAREQQRGEMDLAAQWVTAFWTMVTGAAAVAGVILSAFGVFLVFRTFRAASEGNEIARQAMTAQNRAWMEIEIVSFGQLRLDDGEFRLGIRFRLKNIGKTVALNVEPEVAILKDPKSLAHLPLFATGLRSGLPGSWLKMSFQAEQRPCRTGTQPFKRAKFNSVTAMKRRTYTRSASLLAYTTTPFLMILGATGIKPSKSPRFAALTTRARLVSPYLAKLASLPRSLLSTP